MSIPEEWKNLCDNKVKEILREVADSSPLKAPIPITEIIDSYIVDVNIVTSMDYNFPEGVSAFAKKDMDYGWIIVINGKETVERQRFSAAHELGHIVTLKNQENKVYCSRESHGWVEKMCDRFAGDILMPETIVRKLCEGKPFLFIGDVAKTFKVSIQVAEIQMKRLGLPFASVASAPKRVFVDF
jgi:Zn-dependent peptidase ImmA (M78 family)